MRVGDRVRTRLVFATGRPPLQGTVVETGIGPVPCVRVMWDEGVGLGTSRLIDIRLVAQ